MSGKTKDHSQWALNDRRSLRYTGYSSSTILMGFIAGRFELSYGVCTLASTKLRIQVMKKEKDRSNAHPVYVCVCVCTVYAIIINPSE